MVNIKGELVMLRAVEPEDITSLYEWENDTSLWGVSGTVAPFSHHTLAQFIDAQHVDIYSSRQMRLMICRPDSVVVGAVDLFEFEPQHHRAGVGVMIAPEYRKCGYAKDALRTLETYARQYLEIHQLWCNIEADNSASLALFSSVGYTQIGIKQDWNYSSAGYKSEIMFQKIELT